MYEFHKYPVLDKMFEGVNIVVSGEDYQDYIIPAGEKWFLRGFGASSPVSAEVEFKFSIDAGSSWFNPYDANNDVIRCMHVNKGVESISLPIALEFEGDGENTVLRILVKNLDTVTTSEIIGWFNGWIE